MRSPLHLIVQSFVEGIDAEKDGVAFVYINLASKGCRIVGQYRCRCPWGSLAGALYRDPYTVGGASLGAEIAQGISQLGYARNADTS